MKTIVPVQLTFDQLARTPFRSADVLELSMLYGESVQTVTEGVDVGAPVGAMVGDWVQHWKSGTVTAGHESTQTNVVGEYTSSPWPLAVLFEKVVSYTESLLLFWGGE